MTLDRHGSLSSYGIPADAAGKRMGTCVALHIGYIHGTRELSKGDTIVGETSGTVATIVDFVEPSTVASGHLIAMVSASSVALDFTVGERLMVSGVAHADVGSTREVHMQMSCVAGGNNPLNRAFVDEQGALYVRYSEGEQQLDSFGLSRMTTPTQLAQYFFTFDLLPEDVQTTLVGAGQATHLPTQASAKLTVSDAAGDACTLTTHKYHPYQAGFGQLSEMSVASGDAGKMGLTRRWGYFDDRDGCYFAQIDGVMHVAVKSSADGSSDEDVCIPQTEWNGDRLDGSEGPFNMSKMLLDPTMLNIYWIDLQWLGGGRVRFGVFDGRGDRVTVHTVRNANSHPRPYMRTGKLPLRVQLVNTSATSSGSELRVTTMVVKTEGHVNDTRARRTRKFSGGMPTHAVCPVGAQTAIMSFRSRQYISGAVVNRMLSVPELMGLSVTGAPVLVQLLKGATLTGSNFEAEGTSAVELDVASTAHSGGRCLLSWMFAPGQHNLAFPDNFGLFGESMFLNADGSSGPAYTFVVTPLGDTDAGVRMFVTWIDLE